MERNGRKRVVIVGAGPGGLTAGMILSKNGFDVSIYEKEGQVGGRNGSIKLGDFTFDIGPTFLMMLPVLEEVFSLAGKNLNDYLKVEPLETMYRLCFGEDRILYPKSEAEKMILELERFSKGSSKGYLKYLKRVKKKFETLMPCLKIPYKNW